MATHDQHDAHAMHTSGTTGGMNSSGERLERLSRLDDFKVAEGFPDIRGWEVRAADGTKLGKVDELIVDTVAMRVRYVDVDLDRSLRDRVRNPGSAAAHGAAEVGRDTKNTLSDATDGLVSPSTHGTEVEAGHTLLPIGGVRLDDANDDVVVDAYTAEHVLGLPRYAGDRVTSDYERSLRTSFRDRSSVAGGTSFGDVAGATAGTGLAGAGLAAGASGSAGALHDDYDDDDLYDDNRPFAARRAAMGRTGDEAQRITLSEEQLSVGTRQVQAGEAQIHKAVDVEQVRENVSLQHDEVSLERRPISADAAHGATIGDIGEQSISVPLMREEAIVQKRVVPREEVIVRKQAVTEQRTVEADLRREHLDTTGLEQSRGVGGMGAAGTTGTMGTSGAADRATDSGLLDRAADKLDDLKDRVDGNPASRPGPDATDRRI